MNRTSDGLYKHAAANKLMQIQKNKKMGFFCFVFLHVLALNKPEATVSHCGPILLGFCLLNVHTLKHTLYFEVPMKEALRVSTFQARGWSACQKEY